MKLNRKALKQLIRESLEGINISEGGLSPNAESLKVALEKWAKGPGQSIATKIRNIKNADEQADIVIIMMRAMGIDVDNVRTRLAGRAEKMGPPAGAPGDKPAAAQPGGAPPAASLAGIAK